MRKLVEWSVFVAMCLGVFLLAGPTVLGGSTSYVIVDGTSMEPTYHSGDLVVARARDRYEVGDVITYDAPVGTTFRVIHRVVEVTADGYVTQGDDRDRADGWIVPLDAVHGSSALVLPRAGVVAGLLRQPPVLVAIVAGWATLAVLTRLERRREDAADQAQNPPDDPTRGPATTTWHDRLTTATLVAGMAVLGLGAGVLVASASHLDTGASTLQIIHTDDRPPPASVRITVQWRLFNNGGGQTSVLPPDEVLDLAEGESYTVASRDGSHGNSTYREVACDTVRVEAPTGDRSGSGTWSATSSSLHLVCLQHRPGGGG